MFDKLLIANRGEIAVRIMRTAKRLGMATVAVYSDADAASLHVATADEACHIGPAPATESYLNQQAVIAAALGSGAQAIHPGYGFLAENPDFAAAVTAAGLIFVGPPAAAIRAMGLKHEAKRLMAAAGVPLLPGYHGDGQDLATLSDRAANIGYPVLIKPVAGGGGKGMRTVASAQDLASDIEAAQREAMSAFGDGRLLLEKFIASARHLEVQIMADAHGHVLHLFERDCSLQRRHQKVIEEAPAPGMTAMMRDKLCRAAIAAAKSVGYIGAGTIEFIADAGNGLDPERFYFMEMNTRLQVEHPVTEMVTGLDLVELQLRVASGEPLPLNQEDIKLSGHAIEARLYAEDPWRGFQPQTGRIEHLEFPDEPWLRVDSGVRDGDIITPYYDPMLAKLVAQAPSRAAAITRLATALARTRIAGCGTNLAFLNRLLCHAPVLAGEMATGLIASDLALLAVATEPPPEAVAAALLYSQGFLTPPPSHSPFDTLCGFELWGSGRRDVAFMMDNGRHSFGLERRDGSFIVTAANAQHHFTLLDHDGHKLHLKAGGRIVEVHYFHHDGRLSVASGTARHDFGLIGEMAAPEASEGNGRVVSPVPGLLRKLLVKSGEQVRRGARLAVVESMKMEFTLEAGRDGEVGEILAPEGSQIAEGTVLMTIGASDG